jgi:uncharacterized Tic20 family protein
MSMNDIVAATAPSKDDCNLAMVGHLLGIFTGFVGALILWLVKRDDSAFLADNLREALNFEISLCIATVVVEFISHGALGKLLGGVLFITNLVFCVMAAREASDGKRYRYPYSLRLVK